MNNKVYVTTVWDRTSYTLTIRGGAQAVYSNKIGSFVGVI